MPSNGEPPRAPVVPLPQHRRPQNSRLTNLVVVDQIPLFTEGLRGVLARTPSVRILGTTPAPQAAVSLCERSQPDVVLMDAVLDPRCQFGRVLAAASPAATSPAVLLVVREPLRNARFLSAAAGAGVAGFVLRSASPTRIVEAIRRVHLEGRYLDPDLATLSNGSTVRPLAPATPTTPARQPLSRRELEVLNLIAEGMENQEIAAALFVSVETIRTHVKSILRKLHARDRAHAVALAFKLSVLHPYGDGRSPAATPPSGREHVGGPSLARVTSR